MNDSLDRCIHDLFDRWPTPEEKRQIVFSIVHKPTETLDMIFNFICMYRSQEPEAVLNGKRDRELCDTRHIFYYIAYKLGKHTLTQIADVTDRDHATVIHGVKKMNGLLSYDKEIRNQVEDMMSKLGIE